ncbi:hypothetical protein R3P38DRAFT_2793151 [Favolaschia claudopus]|uniref:Uncharacterized protein n=1 Tax=Favolaschia claudopus TaxID=2862362 RepID=A0AAW0ADN2_9AGAR
MFVLIKNLTTLTFSCRFYWKEGVKVIDRYLGGILTGLMVRRMMFMESKVFRVRDFNCIELRVNNPEMATKWFTAATTYSVIKPQASRFEALVLQRPDDPTGFRIILIDSDLQRDVFWQNLTAAIYLAQSRWICGSLREAKLRVVNHVMRRNGRQNLGRIDRSRSRGGIEEEVVWCLGSVGCRNNFQSLVKEFHSLLSDGQDSIHNERVQNAVDAVASRAE